MAARQMHQAPSCASLRPAGLASSSTVRPRRLHQNAPTAFAPATCAIHGSGWTPNASAGAGLRRRWRHAVIGQPGARTRTNAAGEAGAESTVAVPNSPEETARQAQDACLRAYRDGKLRHRVELLLPLIGATDLDDWPGGIQQQFKAVLPMVETILKGLKQEEGLQGPLQSTILDQGDAVGQWKGDKLASVVFPTGQTLKNVKELAKDSSRLVLMVNPQWQGGQVISDFGIGPWRKANEDFVAEFDEVYHLSQTRISGDECRILRSYPGKWQVHAVDAATGKFPCVAIEDKKPDYARLAEILKAIPGSNSSKSWDERLRSEIQFNTDSLKPPGQ